MGFSSHAKRKVSQDSDFPRTFSWSTSFDTIQSRKPYAQSIPSDIPRFDVFETVLDIAPTITAILDRTTLNVDFDYSCLDELDDQLLFFPTDAFAAICWAEAVDKSAGPYPGHLESRVPEKSNEQVEGLGASSDESESDSDECHSFNEDTIPLLEIQTCSDIVDAPAMTLTVSVQPAFLDASHEPSEKIETKRQVLTSFEFVTLEHRPTQFNPAESIGYFPVPSYQHKVKTTGIGAFCTYLHLHRRKSSVVT
ncbi:hypothetical protein D9615_002326 [Tricholomella constricta]|uniref:Uncharacterized protein n=1 Tax=Tricholomella constricta TaxID=117010 RepID=A0A8H5MA18_9AGAR|nr:hypothetical protein D9615_002326 [Tricholomella constricta]